MAAAAVTAAAAVAPAAMAAPTVQDWPGGTPGFPAGSSPAGIAADGAGVRVALAANPGGVLHKAYTGDFSTRLAGADGWSPNGAPAGVATAPGGATFVTMRGTSAIARVPAEAGAAVQQAGTPTSSAGPTSAVAGPDGTVYVALSDADRVARWNVLGNVEEVALPPGAAPRGIAIGADGRVYVGVNGGIAAVDFSAVGATVSTYAAPGSSRPTDLALAADGQVWFVDEGTNKIGRIAPTGSVDARAFNARALPDFAGITASPDGSVWVGLRSAPAALVRVDVNDQVFPVEPQDAGIVDVAVGADENVWYAGHGSPGHVGRLLLPPRLTALEAREVAPLRAEVAAAIHPRGRATTWWVELGDGRRTPPATIPAGTSEVPVTAALTELHSNTPYQVRLVAQHGDEPAVIGASVGFHTPALPPVDPARVTQLGVDGEVLAPAYGRRVVVAPAKGRVLVRLPGSPRLVPLRATDDVPFGSVLDTRRGTVRLQSAVAPGGATQSAELWAGVFKVQQGGGVTELHLGGPVPTCARPAPRAAAARKRARKRVVRRLWGKDHHGKFRTHGRDSVATVRGTRWLVEESCRSTTTRVLEGAVAVKDRRTGRTRLVKAGGRHVVKRVLKKRAAKRS